MRRISVAAIATTVALAGCPLPQPLPDYPPGTVTPPRILVDQIDPPPRVQQAVRLVPAGCTGPEPVYALNATVFDNNTIEQVEARWFVNYDARFQEYYHAAQRDLIPSDPNPQIFTRVVPTFEFRPYQRKPPFGTGTRVDPPYTEPQTIRVVELVVSNGFDPSAVAPPAPLPERTPLPDFETQVYRWVFLLVPPTATGCDPASDPSCVKCPQ